MYKLIISFICLTLLLTTGCFNDDRKVTMNSLETFKSTMNSSLPVGSGKEQIEEYLTGLKLVNSYVEDEKIIYSMAPNIGNFRLIYETTLLIRFKLDEKYELRVIEYELER
ncbi:MAG: hypothetical protein MJK10_01340 [Pseudomonadales bacterium]|nr:hypothetical protein [Pseudomonadales bacterium]NRA14520.1 hypothetical protein [Oceanospirillaceae bacterium]